MEPISLQLTIDAAQAAEGVQAFVEATRDSLQRDFSTAAETAIRKLDDLNRRQEVLTETILKNAQVIDALKQKRESASQSEQSNLDHEIAKLAQLNEKRSQEITLVEMQKQKVEEKGLISLGGTEAEIAALKKAYDANLASLGSLNDIVKAQNAVHDASVRTTEESIAGIYKVIAEQKIHQGVIETDKQKLAELMSQRTRASSTEQQEIDQQITSLRKSIAGREEEIRQLEGKRARLEAIMALQSASSEKEVAAINTVTEQRLAELGVMSDTQKAQNAVTEATDSTSNSVSRMLGQFAGIVGVTSTIGGVVAALRTVDEVLDTIIAKELAANEGLRNLSNAQISEQQSLDKVFGEYGVTGDPAAKRQIQSTLYGDQSHDSVGIKYGITEEQTAQAAAAIAPVLHAQGIKPGDQRFFDFTGQAGVFEKQGIDGPLIRNTMEDQFRADPNSTPEDLNKRITQLITVAGSPSYANQLGQVMHDHRRNAQLDSISDDDLLKMWQAARAKGLSPEETTETIGRVEQTAGRFVGKSAQDYLDLFQNISGVFNDPKSGPLNKMRIEALKDVKTPSELLQMEEGMTSNVPQSIRDFFTAGAGGGNTDVRSVLTAMGQMPKSDFLRLAGSGGGPRFTANAAAVLGWQDQQLPASGSTPINPTPEQVQTAREEQNKNIAAMNQTISPSAAAFGDNQKNIEDYLKQHQEVYPSNLNPESFMQRWVPGSKMLEGGVTPQMFQRMLGVGEEYVNSARMLQDPNIPATAKAQLRIQMQSLQPFLGGADNLSPAMKVLAGTDDAARATVLSGLHGLGDDLNFVGSQSQWYDKDNSLGPGAYAHLPNNLLNDATLGKTLDQIDTLKTRYVGPNPSSAPSSTPTPGTQGPAAPTPQPSHQPPPSTQPSAGAQVWQPPSSAPTINYHIRQTNYGYSSDSIGGIDQSPNLFG